MTTHIWRGDAPAIAQVDTLTVGGTIEIDDLFIVTIGGKSVTVSAGDTDIPTVAAKIKTALNASTIPEFVENTAEVPQVDTLTVGGTIENDDVFSITINSVQLDVVSGSTDADTVAATIVTAFNNSVTPAFQLITAAAVGSGGLLTLTADTAGTAFTATVETTEDDGGVADDQTFTTSTGTGEYIELTANTAGRPFIVTATTTEVGGGAADDQTFVRAAKTTNEGPEVAQAENFDTGTLPTGADSVIFRNTGNSLKYNLDGFGASGTLFIEASFTGEIGLPDENNDADRYTEYRLKSLDSAFQEFEIGIGEGTGSGRIRLAPTLFTGTITVYSTGTPSDQASGAVRFMAINGTGTAVIYDGVVDVGLDVDVNVTPADISAVTVHGGTVSVGGTVTTLTSHGGTLFLEAVNATVTTLLMLGGEVSIRGAAQIITTVTVNGGTLLVEAPWTFTTMNIGRGGNVIFSAAATITNKAEIAAPFFDSSGIATFSAGYELIGGARNEDVLVDFGPGRTVTLS